MLKAQQKSKTKASKNLYRKDKPVKITLKYDLSFDAPGDEEYDCLVTALKEAGQDYPHSFIANVLTHGPEKWTHSMVEFEFTHVVEGIYTLSFNNLVA